MSQGFKILSSGLYKQRDSSEINMFCQRFIYVEKPLRIDEEETEDLMIPKQAKVKLIRVNQCKKQHKQKL